MFDIRIASTPIKLFFLLHAGQIQAHKESGSSLPENMILPSKPKPPRNGPWPKEETSKAGARNTVQSCGQCCFSIVSASLYPDDLNSFYSKVIDFNGFLHASSAEVSDAALYEAALTTAKMTVGRPDLTATLVNEGVHLTVIGKDEKLTDVPEYSILGPGWDWARGVGPTRWIPVSSCAEENLLCMPSSVDVYYGENICIHETAHALQGSGGKLPTVRYTELGSSENLDSVLRSQYEQSVTNGGLWSGEYSATNHEEHWAEGVQSFYNANHYASANTRNELQSYDNGLYSIINRVFDGAESITCPASTCDCASYQCPASVTVTPQPTLVPTPQPTPDSTPVPTSVPTPQPTPDPTPVPTPQPTPDPTPVPTPQPTPNPAPTSTCTDNEFSFQATKPGENGWVKQKTCDGWVSRKSTAWRCYNVAGVKENCQRTCLDCCEETEETTFVLNGNGREKTCAWAAINPGLRCKKPPTRQMCAVTCGECNADS